MALVLSKDGNPDIYLLNLTSRALTQLTAILRLIPSQHGSWYRTVSRCYLRRIAVGVHRSTATIFVYSKD